MTRWSSRLNQNHDRVRVAIERETHDLGRSGGAIHERDGRVDERQVLAITHLPQVAATATARKLVVLFWHLLTREEDYAFARPAMTRNKIRGLELVAGAPPQKGRKGMAGGKSKARYEAERELSRQAETAYRRLVSDGRASAPRKAGAGTTPGRASSGPSKGKAARQTP